MKCPIDVEKKVAEMRQELHPDALVEDAYRAILGAMNGAYCDGLQGKGAPGDLAAAISDAERSLGEFAGVVQGRIDIWMAACRYPAGQSGAGAFCHRSPCKD